MRCVDLSIWMTIRPCSGPAVPRACAPPVRMRIAASVTSAPLTAERPDAFAEKREHYSAPFDWLRRAPVEARRRDLQASYPRPSWPAVTAVTGAL